MRRPLRILLTVLLATVAVDQLTKYAAVSRLTTQLDGLEGWARVSAFLAPGESAPARVSTELTVIEGFAQLRYSENPGATLGMLGPAVSGLRRPILLLAGALALGFLTFLYFRAASDRRPEQLAFAFILAGALGNYVDRVVRGHVIDFVELYWREVPGLRWPTFNVADVGICVGVVLLLRELLRSQGAEQPSSGFSPGLSRS